MIYTPKDIARIMDYENSIGTFEKIRWVYKWPTPFAASGNIVITQWFVPATQNGYEMCISRMVIFDLRLLRSPPNFKLKYDYDYFITARLEKAANELWFATQVYLYDDEDN